MLTTRLSCIIVPLFFLNSLCVVFLLFLTFFPCSFSTWSWMPRWRSLAAFPQVLFDARGVWVQAAQGRQFPCRHTALPGAG